MCSRREEHLLCQKRGQENRSGSTSRFFGRSGDKDADLAEQLANEHILHVMQNLKKQGYEEI